MRIHRREKKMALCAKCSLKSGSEYCSLSSNSAHVCRKKKKNSAEEVRFNTSGEHEGNKIKLEYSYK